MIRKLVRQLARSPIAAPLLIALLAIASSAVADDAGESDDLEDVLGGFEEEEEFYLESDAGEESEPRWWDLTGSLSLGTSVNYLDHESATGTNYQGLSKLRTRLNLELDLDLPYEWKMRVAGFVFYDFAYLINGRSEYTNEVLDTYEWEIDFQEVYLQGSLLESLDLKLGRQIVNWGRSDSIRILDVLNPLDNREPGLVDIEDLRRPVTMVKLDYFLGDWRLTGIAIPEIRFDLNPPFGSDFNPSPVPPPPEVDYDWFDGHTEWAVALTGIFSGWDISFHWADILEDQPRLEVVTAPGVNPPMFQFQHNRLMMVGAGGNYTVGSWLFKAEIAWLDGFDLLSGELVDRGDGVFVPVFFNINDKSRLDSMVGIEYYGIADHTFALEIANRHMFDYDGPFVAGPELQPINTVEFAFRYTGNLMNNRLRPTLLAVVFGEKAQDGAVVRLSAEYDLRDALVLSGGFLFFFKGDSPPLSTWGKNDRIFFDLRYSF